MIRYDRSSRVWTFNAARMHLEAATLVGLIMKIPGAMMDVCG